MPRAAKLTQARFNALSNADKYNVYSRSEFTVSKRGRTIGGLYRALQWALDHPPTFVEANVVPENTPLEKNLDTIEQQIDVLALRLTEAGEPTPIDMCCNICYEDFNTGKNKPIMYGCGHIICSLCLIQLPRDGLGKRKCQSCRKPIDKFTIIYT